MEKCKTCGGDGLIYQGESIKFTCSACMGTGKVTEYPAVSSSEEVTTSSEEVKISDVLPVEKGFSEDSLEESSPEVV